jgi:two-component system LytT family response regulator
LLLRQAGRVRVVPLDTVRWIEADGNYVRVHSTMGVFRMRSTLGDLSARLAAQLFEQVHRSAIANLKYVRELIPLPSGDSDVILDTGERLTLSRTFRDAVRVRLAHQLSGVRPAGPQLVP